MTADEQLAQALSAHADWLRSQGSIGRRLDLRRQDLRLLDLSEVDLTNAVLFGANLERTDLRGATLVAADLREARLGYARLENANLRNANLSGALAHGARLIGAQLHEAVLDRARFDDAICTRADFTEVRGRHAQFNRSDLQSTKFDGALLEDAKFLSCNLTNASMRESRLWGVNFLGAQHDGMDLHNASLEDISFDIGSSKFERPEHEIKLSPQQTRRALKLHRYGKTPGEIANTLGVGREVIKNNLAAALSEGEYRASIRRRRHQADLLKIITTCAFGVAAIALIMLILGGVADFVLSLTRGRAMGWPGAWYAAWIFIAIAGSASGLLAYRSRMGLLDRLALSDKSTAETPPAEILHAVVGH